MAGLILGGGYLLATNLAAIVALFSNVLYLSVLLLALGAIIFLVLDPKMRALVSYMYKSVMRWITGLFVQIDPIGILKSYIDDLKGNLSKMNKQITQLRGQMHKLKEIILNNQKEIKSNLSMASQAKQNDKTQIMILKSRKAGRLKESNMKLEDLYRKMEILYRVLNKMYESSSIMLEDVQDQVMVKEQERKAIRTSHSAMKSAMSVMSGDPDKRAMFDAAMEAVTDDVANKVGEMERFMEMPSNLMQSIDLQNGVFEEEGMNMLEKWEKESSLMLLEGGRTKSEDTLDLDSPVAQPEKRSQSGSSDSSYDNFFE